MNNKPIDRRDFLKELGMASALFAATPWLSVFSESKQTNNEKCRLGIIGPGSRGRLHMSFLAQNPKAEMAAICDIYQPSIDEALKIAPKAKVYRDYRQLLDDKSIDAVLIVTPLNTHYQIFIDILLKIVLK